jgi:prefoldin subunit 5
MERRSGERDEDRDRRGEHKEIEILESKIATLEATISSLQGKVTTLESHLAAVQSNPALALGPFVSVDPNRELLVKLG